MQEFLRTLRIITFLGITYIAFFVFACDVELGYMVSCAFKPTEIRDFFYTFCIGSCVGYPVLFLLSVLYLWIHYGGVTWGESTRDKVGLLHLFLQNEVQLIPNIVFKWHNDIFKHNSNWLGASFIGINRSKGIVKIIRRIIGAIAYVVFPVIMPILIIILILVVYVLIGICFLH